MHCLTVLEVRNPKSVCQEGHDPHRGSGEEPFLPHLSFWWLSIAGISQLAAIVHRYLFPLLYGILPLCPHVSMSVLLFL